MRSNESISIILMFAILLVVVGIIVLLLFNLSDKDVIVIDQNGISIKTFLYPTKLDWSEVEIKDIKIMNFENDRINVGIRTNGVGMPGLNIGWFSSSNGKLKLYLTNNKTVLKIPTKKGFTVYISTKNGDEILKKISMQNK